MLLLLFFYHLDLAILNLNFPLPLLYYNKVSDCVREQLLSFPFSLNLAKVTKGSNSNSNINMEHLT